MSDFIKLLRGADFSGGETYEKCLCLKLIPASKCRKVYSGVKNYTEVLCKDCAQNTKDYARIVCLGCKRLAAFLPPQRHASGFVFERNRHYHIRSCSFCTVQEVAIGEATKAIARPVIELEAYVKERHGRTEPDKEIFRHAEQIRLPSDSEFAKVARRFEQRPAP